MRISTLESCAHSFFDELRMPGARMPNGRDFPSLFNFSQQGTVHVTCVAMATRLYDMFAAFLTIFIDPWGEDVVHSFIAHGVRTSHNK